MQYTEKETTVKKGDICEGIIENYDFPNKGSLYLDDRKVTIKGALKGQKVRFMITRKKSGMAEGRLLEVIEKSPMEDEVPDCPFFGVCGGCTYLNMSYKNQLALKEEMQKKLLAPVINESIAACGGSGSSDFESIWEGILPSPLIREYRNKMEFTFGDEYKDGPLALGLHRKGNFYDILNVSGCRIIGEDWSKILDYSLDFFRDANIPFYHKMRHEGVLRNLVIRQSKATGEFLINLVASTQWDRYMETGQEMGCRDDDMAYRGKAIIEKYAKGLVSLSQAEDFSGSIGGILYTENDSLGDVVQSDRTILLYGRDYIIEEIMGLRFKISPFSFFQTNTKGCEVLYKKAREYIMAGEVIGASDINTENGREPSKVVFDLYSGTGTIAQMMAPVSKKVVGIELVEEAVMAARENAGLNGLDNCEFISGDVLKAIDLVEDTPDLIILDPPRDGINPKALDKILAFGVDEMVYISCKPTSLARDLKTILASGYTVKRVCGVDQFPGSVHVETVCLLSRKDK